jgi:hypothetical protein
MALYVEVDRSGVLELGEETPVDAVSAVTDIPPEIVNVGLSKLIKRNVVEVNRNRNWLVIRDFIESQEAKQSDRLRQKESRAKRATLAKRSDVTFENVTNRDITSQIVTVRHDQSQPVTTCHSEIRSDQIKSDPPVVPPTESVTVHEATIVSARPTGSDAKKAEKFELAPEQTQENHGEITPRPRRRLEDITALGELCRALELNPHNASHYDVRLRPEVVAANEAYSRAVGLAPRRLGAYGKDAGVRALVALFALDYSLEEILELVQYAPKDPWIMGTGNGRTGRPADVSALTPAKAGELLNMAKSAREKSARREAKRQEELERERRERASERKNSTPDVTARAAISAVLTGAVFQTPPPPSAPRRPRNLAELDLELERTAASA